MPRGSDRAKRRTALAAISVVAGMVGLSYAAVPLYDMFCRVTGYGGTTQEAAGPSEQVVDRPITVRFDASVNGGLPWSFTPVQRQMELLAGENALAFYRARNRAEAAEVGTATFNVTPQKAGAYFVKVECFCFTEQRLAPGESVDMPVAFYVDPAIADDPAMDDVDTITLSYTFFRVKNEEDPDQVAAAADQLPGR